MTAVAGERIIDPAPELTRWSMWLLVAVHVPVLLAPSLLSLNPGVRTDTLDPVPEAVLVGVAATVLTALQVRHSLAAARGVRPRGWAWTLLAIVVTAYVPQLWLSGSWAIAQWAVGASVIMFLPVRIAVPVVAALVFGTGTAQIAPFVLTQPELGVPVFALAFGYHLLIMTFGCVALPAAAGLVRVVDELAAARAELADLAVGQERLRVSRDLHDLLGQSLSAVSLKGDLAIRLWTVDRAAAMAEVEGLTEVARGALRDVRAVTFDEHVVSLRAELDGAGALLAAAGIRSQVDVALPDPDRAVDEALGWVLREAVTNVLRHSEATEVGIRATRSGGRVHLEIVNDGARGTADGGSGLAGLAERVRPLGGVVDGRRAPGGRFRLTVELPEEAS